MQEIRPGDAKSDFLGVIPHGCATSNFLVSRERVRANNKDSPKPPLFSPLCQLLVNNLAATKPLYTHLAEQLVAIEATNVKRRFLSTYTRPTPNRKSSAAPSASSGRFGTSQYTLETPCLTESVTRSPSKVPAKYMLRRSPYTVDCDWSARVLRLHVQTSLAPPTQGGQDS